MLHSSLKNVFKNCFGFIFLLYFTSINNCFAVYFEHLSVDDGLSQGTVYSIIQDKYGFLWFGTTDGLNRYDGVEFIHFKNTTSGSEVSTALSDTRIHDIIEDENGDFWISTKNGINFFDIETYQAKRFFHDPQDPNSLPHNTTYAKAFDSKGMLWIATSGGLSRFDPNTEKFTTFLDNREGLNAKRYKCSNVSRAIQVDDNDNIWVGSDNSLCKFDPVTERFELIDYRNDFHKSASVSVVDLLFSKRYGVLWVASVEGLFKYNPVTDYTVEYRHDPNDINSLPHDWLSSVEEFGNDQLWVATTNGLGLLDIKDGKFKKFVADVGDKQSLSGNEIFSLYIDESNLVWIGTSGNGLSIYNSRQDSFKHITTDKKKNIDNSLSDPSVWEIVKAYGYLWIGTSNGLNRYDMESAKVKQYMPDPSKANSLVNSNVVDIVPGKYRDLWIGTWDGISHFYMDDERFVNFKKKISDPETYPLQITMSLHYDIIDDLVWVGSSGHGIARFDPNTEKFTRFKHDPKNANSISNDYITNIYKSTDGLIWFATSSGLDSYNPKTNKFKQIYHGDTRIGVEAYSIREDRQGNMLVASPNGLSIYNPKSNQLVRSYTTQDGLDDDYIYSIEIDNDGFIWVSTNLSLSRINPATHEVKNFDVLDGLQGYEFNGDASFNDGKNLYFGGYNGLNYFNPKEVNTTDYTPSIVITNFNVLGRQLNPRLIKKSIPLSYKDNFFAIEFAVLDYTNPRKNQYAYKLEGFDNDWVYSGNRNYASYTNLSGGTYYFHAKGANKYGVWNTLSDPLEIRIQSAPWLRWWAFVIYFASFLVIILFTVRFRSLAEARALAENLRRISTSLMQSLNLDTIQNQLANHLRLILPYEHILIFLRKENMFYKSLDFGLGLNRESSLCEKDQQKLLGYILKERHPLLINSSLVFSEFDIQSSSLCKGSLLVLPLITRKNLIGAVVLYNTNQQNCFRKRFVDIAVTLGAQASASIDNARLFEETKQLAFYDALTGLENRRLFKERIELALKRIKRNNSELAVLFLDLDKFKRINDNLGHDAGDALLVEAGKRLLKSVRAQDTVARIGGDEFTILLNDIKGTSSVHVIAKKILKAFAEPISLAGQEINISTSIGVSIAPKDSMDANVLMKNADLSMYKAKEAGRNNYQFFTEEMNLEASGYLALENEIRAALKGNQLGLVYQPLIDLSTRSIDSLEAFVRWSHPQKGPLLPVQFVKKIEEAGLVNLLGEWVLRNACCQAKKVQEICSKPIKVWINLSIRHIAKGNFAEYIGTMLEEYQLSPECLGLEINENELIKDSYEIVNVLTKLKRKGINLAIDDFGTGYSSLGYLKRLPVNVVKIDRSFIERIPVDDEAVEITDAIIAMSHKLNLKVVAEGVETESQFNFLHKKQCDMAQGFYFSDPVKPDDLRSLLEKYFQEKTNVLSD